MSSINQIFAHRRLDSQRLKASSFTEQAGTYRARYGLLDNKFSLEVVISAEGAVATTVIDNASGEEYILHRIAGTRGEFIGRLRDEYLQRLNEIAECGFLPEVFHSPMTKRVLAWLDERYGDAPEFLWPRFPDNAIVRRRDNRKWYAAILTVACGKIGLAGDERIEILNLRMSSDDLTQLIDGERYFPGFHMSKKHWVSLRLDETLPFDEICQRIEESYLRAQK